jgi:hypothetical protein
MSCDHKTYDFINQPTLNINEVKRFLQQETQMGWNLFNPPTYSFIVPFMPWSACDKTICTIDANAICKYIRLNFIVVYTTL